MRNNQLAHTLFRLIVLAGFGVFLVVILFKTSPVPKHQQVLKFNLMSDKPDGLFGSIYVMGLFKNKVITNYNLSSNPRADDKVFDAIDQETRRLNITNDTVQVLKIHFIPENAYGQFVKLANIMQQEMTWRYILTDDDFYIFGNPKQDTPPTIDSAKSIQPVYM